MTKERPLIGINADFIAPAKGRAPRTVLSSGYYDCILTAGGLPVILPPLIREHELAPIVDYLDGIILTEGDDMEPRKMGLGPHPSIKVMNDRRESSDRLLCKIAQQRKMPILGIGAGMQEMTVCFGGGIYQHLPEDLPKAIPHRDPQGEEHRHVVVMAKGSMMEDIYGDGEICVNSYHHQGLRKLPTGFRAGALAPDGLVEAIEWAGEDWFAVGVQWHPQNEGNISLDMQLIEAFVNAAAKWTGAKVAKPALSLAKAG
jgi:putative glutamine amidotransferase